VKNLLYFLAYSTKILSDLTSFFLFLFMWFSASDIKHSDSIFPKLDKTEIRSPDHKRAQFYT